MNVSPFFLIIVNNLFSDFNQLLYDICNMLYHDIILDRVLVILSQEIGNDVRF